MISPEIGQQIDVAFTSEGRGPELRDCLIVLVDQEAIWIALLSQSDTVQDPKVGEPVVLTLGGGKGAHHCETTIADIKTTRRGSIIAARHPAGWSSTVRRAAARVRCALPMQLMRQSDLASCGTRMTAGVVLDLSTTGCRVRSRAELGLGDAVLLTFELPYTHETFTCIAVVTRVIAARSDDDAGTEFAVRYDKLSGFMRWQLTAALDEWMKRTQQENLVEARKYLDDVLEVMTDVVGPQGPSVPGLAPATDIDPALLDALAHHQKAA